jgi:surface protein
MKQVFTKKMVMLAAILLTGWSAGAQDWNQVTKAVAGDRTASQLYGASVDISGSYAIVGASYDDKDANGENPVTDAGSAYIMKNSGGTWIQMQKIVASDRGISDHFGSSVAICGDYAIVGAHNEDHDVAGSNQLDNAGSAYVYQKVGDTWTQVQKLVASDRAAGDYFGYSVSITDGYALVGAYYKTVSGKTAAGVAYVFKNNTGTWAEVQRLDMGTSSQFYDYLGYSVSIDCNYALVGANGEDEDAGNANTVANAGGAYIYQNISGTWTLMQKVVATDRQANDEFGASVSISGDYALMGAYREDDDAAGSNSLSGAGSAYIFKYTTGTWSQVQKIAASDRGADDYFGISVSISGDYAIVGAREEDEDAGGANTLASAGSAYIFKNNSGTWGQDQKIVASVRAVDDRFACDVAISENYAVVGAYGEDEDASGANTLLNAGAAYFFKNTSVAEPMQLVFTTTAAGQSIQLPLYGTVNCTVDWGDGSSTESFTTIGNKPHTFAAAGTYTVEISGALTQFGLDYGEWTGVLYLTEVVSFGDLGLTSLKRSFRNADNLLSVPAALPATVTTLTGAFSSSDRPSFTNLNLWDVSHVTSMSSLFFEASNFNQDITSWDVSSATNTSSMFESAYGFNQPIGNWDVSHVTFFSNMFSGCRNFNQSLASWDVHSAVSLQGMFKSARAFNQDISSWNVSNATNFVEMFFGATSFNQDISDWNVSNATTMTGMFMFTTLPTAIYDAMLTKWAALSVQPSVNFHGGYSKYSTAAAAARATLTGAPKNWTITDGGLVTYPEWTGTVSSDWNTAANWSTNVVPTASDEVTIANAGTAPVIEATDQITCDFLTVNPDASLTIESGGSLIVVHEATGNVTVKRDLEGLSQYHFLSSPVNNADLATIFDAGVQNEVYLRRFDEPTGNWVNLEIPATLTNGVGYCYVRQSKSTGTTATFTGSLITSTLPCSLTNLGTVGGDQYTGYNLLGNPFSSPIQFLAGGDWNQNDIDYAVYVWSDGVYKSYVFGTGGALTDAIIPAQQGFFVKANGPNPTLQVPKEARIHSSQAYYKNSVANVLRLDVAGNMNEYVDGTFIHFTPEATPLFDSRFDAYKLNNDPDAPMIYTHAGDATLSINSLPAIEDCNEVAVSFTAGVDGRYTITASGMETFANGNITLTDLATNATQNLAQNPVYSFDATTSDQPHRFKVSFATVGVDENPLQNIGVYATNGQIVLQLPQVTKATATITNLAGQLVAQHNINASGVATLDAPVTTGVYMVTITTGAATITRKVIVK